jgi:UDP-N-acetylmuramoylalanine--D-glutamate ligase
MARPPASSIDLGDLTLESFRGRPVAVLGLARSGIAAARFLADQGAQVTVYDTRSADQLSEAIAALGAREPRLLLGSDVDPREALAGQALICTSPSISSRYPTTEPRLRAVLAEVEAEGLIPVVSEVDLFLRLCPAATVGVTGTKGKTTTSSLAAAILSVGDAPVVLGGNIGVPLIERLPELTSGHRVVLELSELQLPTLSRGTDIAVYTHVTSDHLDRHGSLEAYRAVKQRLAELLPIGGVLVRNEDDSVVAGYVPQEGAKVVSYAQGVPATAGVGVVDGWIMAGAAMCPAGHDGRILPLADIPIPGRHNVSNVLAAVAVGLLHGVAPTSIAEAVRGFGGVEHRLEHVAQIDGVTYINDSQGTQPDAVIAAVNAFELPLVLIAGGRSKGVPVAALAEAVAERVSAAVLIGETAGELATAFAAAGLERVERAASMEAAVQQATAIASERRPATVLLSPAAASFDMFRDYEARGRAFKAAVSTIADDKTADDAGAVR